MLSKIKNDLVRIYDIDLSGIDIKFFLGLTKEESYADGMLEIRQEDDELGICLRFSDEIYRWMADTEKNKTVMKADTYKMLTIIEETSHFCYVAWKCGIQDIHPRHLSRTELEMQGFIDAYILLTDYSLRASVPPMTIDAFFGCRKIDENHPENYKHAYKKAIFFARPYLNFLHGLLAMGRRDDFMVDLKKFYRKNEMQKIEHINYKNRR